MNSLVLLDSDVLIDFLRGQPLAVTYLENLTETPLLSVVAVAELFSGVRDGNERRSLEAFVASVPSLKKIPWVGQRQILL